MTDEQRERLKQIRERRHAATLPANQRGLLHTASWVDIDFFLSLLDSHALNCNAADWAIERVQSEYLRGRVEGTTSMRSRCVEKVEAMADEWTLLWQKDLTGDHGDKHVYSMVARKIAKELKSLPLEQVEQEKTR